MIFLGSKKYPGEAQFEEFLAENGGESNAYTECEYTCRSESAGRIGERAMAVVRRSKRF